LAGITGCYVGDELVQVIHPYCSRQIKQGNIWHEDYSHYSMILRFKAAAKGVPFLPTHSQIGTDLINPDYDVERKVGLRGKDSRFPLEKFHVILVFMVFMWRVVAAGFGLLDLPLVS
jgi:glutaconate CoA-transferase subunit A